MPSILNLKFKGNKSFVAFSNLADTDTLTSTWKVCTKVASYLEQGQRLENLSWRLWHLQNLMVDTDNAKSKREFKKLSKCMGDKLDKEKGRSIEELEAPDFKRNHSTDLLRQRAAEKERSREASQNAKPGTIKRMQFTFSIDHPSPASWSAPATKPDLKPSSEFKGNSNKRVRASTRPTGIDNDSEIAVDAGDIYERDQPLTKRGLKLSPTTSTTNVMTEPPFDPRAASLLFPSLFSTDFNPSALLYPTPSVTNRMNYGEGVGTASSDGFSITRPTIELPLDDILNGVDTSDGSDVWSSPFTSHHIEIPQNNYIDSMSHSEPQPQVDMQQDVVMHSIPDQNEFSSCSQDESDESDDDADDESYVSTPVFNMVPPPSQSVREHLPHSMAPSFIRAATPRARTKTPMGRPSLTLKTDALSKRSALGATATNINSALLRQGGESTNSNPPPSSGKAECSNCGATHTPLWRRGLNDELNCNACGLYCKLHKRPRPKSMRNTHGETRAQTAPRPETVDVMARTAQCYNCHTTATPLWRKDDEGKTVCNACGLYYKLHGSSRPISMKSDVIRKRSRHDARRGSGSGSGTGSSETPSVSRDSSPMSAPDLERSPTLAPDSTTQMSYDFVENSEFRTSRSELMGALGNTAPGNYSGIYTTFPGPYHPDYLSQQSSTTPADALPFSSTDSTDSDAKEEDEEDTRTSKRRRMSTDSEPPSSAVSFSSYNDGYSSQSSATSHSQRSSMDFPFNNNYQPYCILRGSGNTFWHPPMAAAQDSPQLVHPPMLPAEESPMDYPHPPMLPQEEDSLFNQYLHPPVVPADDSTKAFMHSLQSHSMFHNEIVYTGNGTLRSDFFDTTMHSY